MSRLNYNISKKIGLQPGYLEKLETSQMKETLVSDPNNQSMILRDTSSVKMEPDAPFIETSMYMPAPGSIKAKLSPRESMTLE